MVKPHISRAFEYNNKIKIVAVMNMNNPIHSLVDYYDVGKFSCTNIQIHQIPGAATTCIVQPATIYYGIGRTLIGLQDSFANTYCNRLWLNDINTNN